MDHIRMHKLTIKEAKQAFSETLKNYLKLKPAIKILRASNQPKEYSNLLVMPKEDSHFQGEKDSMNKLLNRLTK